MKKYTLALMTFATVTAMVACAKKDHASPTAKADPKTDSPAVLDAKQAQAKADMTAPNSVKPANTMVGKRFVQAPPEGANRWHIDDKEVQYALTDSYHGPDLSLAYPNNGNFGWIHIDDDDAKAMYNALRVKSVPTLENVAYAAGVSKSGHNIRCFVAAPKESPQVPEYSCSIYIDYVAGAVNTMPPAPEFDPSVPELTQRYIGEKVTLDPAGVRDDQSLMAAGTQERINGSGLGMGPARETYADHMTPRALPMTLGSFQFDGNDARALYYAMKVDAVDATNSGITAITMEKKGRNILCTKSLTGDSAAAVLASTGTQTPVVGSDGSQQTSPMMKGEYYRCNLKFNYINGKVIDLRLAPIVFVEPGSDAAKLGANTLRAADPSAAPAPAAPSAAPAPAAPSAPVAAPAPANQVAPPIGQAAAANAAPLSAAAASAQPPTVPGAQQGAVSPAK